MASAKQRLVPVKSHQTGTTIKVECAACYDEEGSYACIRPAHEAFNGVERPVTKELLADAIVRISDAAKSLEKSGLNKRGIIALIADDTKLGKGTISTVLNSLEDLAKNYAKPKVTGTNSAGPR
jgi:hypothetical protein